MSTINPKAIVVAIITSLATTFALQPTASVLRADA